MFPVNPPAFSRNTSRNQKSTFEIGSKPVASVEFSRAIYEVMPWLNRMDVSTYYFISPIDGSLCAESRCFGTLCHWSSADSQAPSRACTTNGSKKLQVHVGNSCDVQECLLLAKICYRFPYASYTTTHHSLQTSQCSQSHLIHACITIPRSNSLYSNSLYSTSTDQAAQYSKSHPHTPECTDHC